AGLVKGEGFAVDASVMEADASRYHGKAPGEIDWSAPERQTRAVADFLTALDDEDADADRKPPKVVSPVDPCSAWTAKANKRVQFGYGLNYLIHIKYAVIVDVEATPARRRRDPTAHPCLGHEQAGRGHPVARGLYLRSGAQPLHLPSGKVSQDNRDSARWQDYPLSREHPRLRSMSAQAQVLP